MEGARFVAEAQTAPGFGLERLGGYLALVPLPGSASCVPGELFEVSGELLATLDRFEGPDYERLSVPVRRARGLERKREAGSAREEGEAAEAGEMGGELRFALAYLKKAR